MTIAIEVKGLVKVYDGKVRALDGVDLKVKAGNVFALLGPNGSGKTTLMRILTTQFKPTSGEASIFGFDVVRMDSEIRKIISYVPQEMSVWTDISGFENILIYHKIYGLPSGDRKKVIRDALEGMGLEGVADNLVKTYSGGMIRRLEMAIAMIIKPRILFLDEPTLGLDPSARKIVWEKLLTFKKEYNTTVFFNTHYMDEADLYSDEIAIINRGKIVMSGTADELKHSLRKEVIKLDLNIDIVDKNVLNRIRNLDFVNDLFMNGSQLSVVIEDAETELPVVMEVLRNEDISVLKISMTRPTLDDVFLKYAGTISVHGGDIREIKQVRSKKG